MVRLLASCLHNSLPPSPILTLAQSCHENLMWGSLNEEGVWKELLHNKHESPALWHFHGNFCITVRLIDGLSHRYACVHNMSLCLPVYVVLWMEQPTLLLCKLYLFYTFLTECPGCLNSPNSFASCYSYVEFSVLMSIITFTV
jgi:hypothetical protein